MQVALGDAIAPNQIVSRCGSIRYKLPLDDMRNTTIVGHALDLYDWVGVLIQFILEHCRHLDRIFTTYCNYNALYGGNQYEILFLIIELCSCEK